MECERVPAVTEEQLLAYLAEEATPEVAEHIAGCPSCTQRLERLTGEQRALRGLLYRVLCPEPLELGEYRMALLPYDRGRQVARHLADCPHCATELAQLDQFVAESSEGLEWGVLDHLRVIVASLIPASGPGELAPAYAAVRGEVEGPSLYRADDLQLSLESQPTGAPNRRTLVGLVMGEEALPTEAQLLRAGASVAQTPIDGLGNFTIADLEPGHYELRLVAETREVIVRGLTI